MNRRKSCVCRPTQHWISFSIYTICFAPSASHHRCGRLTLHLIFQVYWCGDHSLTKSFVMLHKQWWVQRKRNDNKQNRGRWSTHLLLPFEIHTSSNPPLYRLSILEVFLRIVWSSAHVHSNQWTNRIENAKRSRRTYRCLRLRTNLICCCRA